MKNKGLSVLLSFVLVLILTVSFSMSVSAASGLVWQCDEFSFTSSVIHVRNGLDYDYINNDSEYKFSGNSGSLIFRIPLKLYGLGVGGDITLSGDAVSFMFKGQSVKVNVSSADESIMPPSVYIQYVNLVCEEKVVPMPFNTSQWKMVNYEYFTDELSVHDLLYVDVCVYYECEPSSVFDLQAGNISVTFTCNGLSIYDIDTYNLDVSDIENQTDTLTNGYDSSSMSSSNTALSGSIAEFTGAESQITDQSVSFIDGVQFYDLQTKPQLLACITFCSSWLQSLFVNIGDWGILVMVSLSLGFGLMLIGWFKYRRK